MVALKETAEHLGVHALERVGAENGLVGARVDIVRVVRAGLEVLALVVTGENGSGQEPARRLGFRLDEQKVQALAFVQSRHTTVPFTI